MNELQTFNHADFGSIRTLNIDGEAWFIGKDVAAVLGYGAGNKKSKALTNALSDHVEDEDKKHLRYKDLVKFSSGRQNGDPKNFNHYGAIIINESGLYSLIMGSKLPTAKKFKRWVTSEVLPAIRKTGSYTTAPPTEHEKKQLEVQEKSNRIQAAQLLHELAKEYKHNADYAQILSAYATKELTGKFLLPLPEVQEKTYSAAEIGEMLGISAWRLGRIANQHGLKTAKYGKYFIDKSPYSGIEVETFRYFPSIIDAVNSILSGEEGEK